MKLAVGAVKVGSSIFIFFLSVSIFPDVDVYLIDLKLFYPFFYLLKDKHHQRLQFMYKKSITISDWRDMLVEIREAGYTLREISRVTGVSRTTLDRWSKSDKELPHHYLFSKMLYFYSHHHLKKSIFA